MAQPTQGDTADDGHEQNLTDLLAKLSDDQVAELADIAEQMQGDGEDYGV